MENGPERTRGVREKDGMDKGHLGLDSSARSSGSRVPTGPEMTLEMTLEMTIQENDMLNADI
jgi:hypothetical protein